jgi:hypothetical protein
VHNAAQWHRGWLRGTHDQEIGFERPRGRAE